MNARRVMAWLLGLFTLITLAACGGGGGGNTVETGGEPGPNKKTAIFTFQFGSNDVAPQQAGGAHPMGVVTVDGYLLVVPRQGDPKVELYQFSVNVDESAWQISTEFDLPLEPRTYDIYFLLNTPNKQFGGLAQNQIIVDGGDNPIKIVVNPILFDGRVDIEGLRSLDRIVALYDATDLAGYGKPRIGISIDGGPELYFNIKVNASRPELLLFVTAGNHTIRVRFFDGAVVTDSGTTDTGGGGSTEVVTSPLTSDVNIVAQGDSEQFFFTVPPDVAREVGGLTADGDASSLNQKLKTIVSIVGPANDLVEEEVNLTPELDESNNEIRGFQGSLIVENFIPGSITWQLRFIDRSSGELIAYCAKTVNSANVGKFACDLKLLVRVLTTKDPTGMLHVTVEDANGRVSGAVVMLNGKPLGVTGAGTPGEPLGELSRFITQGKYAFQVVDQILDPFGSGQIFTRSSAIEPNLAIESGATTERFITLPGFPFRAPTVTGTTPSEPTTDWPITSPVSVQFSQAMNPVTTAAGVTLKMDVPDAAPVPGVYSWSLEGKALQFKPDPALEYNHSYVLHIDTSATDTFGSTLASGRDVHFKTGMEPDTTSPSVVGVSPRDGATGQDVRTVISVRFSEPMDTASLEADGVFQVMPKANTKLDVLRLGRGSIPGRMSWADGNVLIFTPDNPLAFETTYIVTVSSGATDVAGNPLAPNFTSSFTTSLEQDVIPPTIKYTSPVGGATDVAVKSAIRVAFSEPMRADTVQKAFHVLPDTAGNFSWSPDIDTVTFTPSADLKYVTSYTVTIGETAADSAGNLLKGGASFGFKTVEAPVSDTIFDLMPGRFTRPRHYDDNWVNVTSPITVRVPTMEDIAVAKDSHGDLLGDPDRFLMVLYFGKVRCMYLGGKWDRHVGGVVERVFEHAFQSPVCNGNDVKGGSLVTINPGDIRDNRFGRHGDHDDHDRDGHDNRDHDRNGDDGDRPSASGAQIRARVISANPRFPETRLHVVVEVSKFTAPLPPVLSDGATSTTKDHDQESKDNGKDNGKDNDKGKENDSKGKGKD